MRDNLRNSRELYIEIPDTMVKICITEISGKYTISWALEDLEGNDPSQFGEFCMDFVNGELKYHTRPQTCTERTYFTDQKTIIFHLEGMRQNFFIGRCPKYSEQHRLFVEYRDLLDQIIIALKSETIRFRVCAAG